jgi:hypothetical protein
MVQTSDRGSYQKRQPHAINTKEGVELIECDVDYQVKVRFTKLIPWGSIKDAPP